MYFRMKNILKINRYHTLNTFLKTETYNNS